MKFLSILLITLTLTSMLSCSKESSLNDNVLIEKDNILTEENFAEYIAEVKSNLDNNAVFVQDFIELSKDNEMNQKTMLKMLDVLNISDNINVERLDEMNLANNIYEVMLRHSEQSSLIQARRAIDCDLLVEIRDAMIDECEQYILGLEQACSAAVMIAYWYHEESCT